MGSRLELQTELEELLGSENVYYQPPESQKLIYDCIVYQKRDIRTNNADDMKYLSNNRYELTLIYRNPDSNLSENVLRHFQYSSFERHFTSDNLNHDVITIYY